MRRSTCSKGLQRRLNVLLLQAAYPDAIEAGKAGWLHRYFVRVLEVVRPGLEWLGKARSGWLVVLVIGTIPLTMLLRGLFTYLNVYLMSWVSVRAVADLRARLFSHLMDLSASFFNRVSTGELMSRLGEVQGLHQAISQAMVTMIKEPV